MKPPLSSLLRVVLVASIVGNAAAATTYTLVDLGPGTATGVNLAGKVVGNAAEGGWYYDGQNRSSLAFQCRYLGAPPEQLYDQTASSANAINDTGMIVGHVTFPGPMGGTLTPYLLPSGGVATLLGLGAATAVNAAGTAVGGSGSGAFVLAGSTLTVPGGPLPRPYAINDGGLVVGSVAPDSLETAARFDGAGFAILDLSGLGLPAPAHGGYYASQALAANNAGVIVGKVRYESGSPLPKPGWAFLHANGSSVSLGFLGGYIAAAKDINTDGIVVGTATIADGTPHAFVYSAGVMSDLNALVASGGAGWVLGSANAVNDAGAIVGEGTVAGVVHAFLLRPSSTGLPPSIDFQPHGASVFLGEPFELSVTASGTPELTYQWQHAGTNLPAATARTYAVAHAGLAEAGSYRVVVSNPYDSATSDTVQVEVKVLAELDIAMYAGLLVGGPVGRTFRIEAVEHLGDTNWQSLATLTLDSIQVFWVDRTTPVHLSRIYRAVPVP